MNAESRYDYVIVGGGTAGCVLASRLSEDPSVRVALVEAGPRDRSPLLTVPAGVIKVAGDPRFNWGYMTEPQAELGGRRLPFVQARVLGGGSSINGMVYTRGMASDYDSWRDLGVEGWDHEALLPYFMRSEHSDTDSPDRGRDGPLATTRARPALGVVEDIVEAMRRAGYAWVEDLASAEPDGFGRYDWAISKGRRSSSASSFGGLRGGRPNLHLLVNARAKRVLLERDRADLIEIEELGAERLLRAEREIILCAGAIGSAALLLRSGIGPADQLREAGVTVQREHPQVGRNLSNHMSYRLEYRYGRPTTARRFLTPWGGLGALLGYAIGRRGFLGHGTSPLGGFFRSDPALPRPDMQLFVAPVLFGTGPGVRGLLPDEHGFSLSISQGVPWSRGAMWLQPGHPNAAPAIDPAAFRDRRDLEATIDAIGRMRDLAGGLPLARHITGERRPGAAVRTRGEIEDAVRREARPYFHPVGTCRMGRAVGDSVTDSQLRVHGIEGLRVADASVMPRLVNGNLNAPVMMIAERAADFIRGVASIDN